MNRSAMKFNLYAWAFNAVGWFFISAGFELPELLVLSAASMAVAMWAYVQLLEDDDA